MLHPPAHLSVKRSEHISVLVEPNQLYFSGFGVLNVAVGAEEK